MGLLNWLKGATIATTFALSSYFATPAFAQDSKHDDYARAQAAAGLGVERSSPTQDNSRNNSNDSTLDSIIDDFAFNRPRGDAFNLDGYLRLGGHLTPDADGLFGEAGLSFNFNDYLKPRFYALSNLETFDVQDGPDLDLFSNRLMFGNSFNFYDGLGNEFFIEPQVGYEWNDFKENIDLDMSRFIYGGQTGFVGPGSGTFLMFSGYGSTGNHDGALRSGFEVEGDYNNFYLGLAASQQLSSGQSTGLGRGYRTDWNDDAEIVNAYKDAWNIFASAYLTNGNFQGLLNSDGEGARLGVEYVLNMREYDRDESGNIFADGLLWRFAPVIQYDHATSDGDNLSLRETETNKLRLGFAVTLEHVSRYVGFRLDAEAGYQWMNTNVNDPGAGNNDDYRQDGAYFGLTASFGF